MRNQTSKQNFERVCHFVVEKIYLPDSKLRDFHLRCVRSVAKFDADTPLKLVLDTYNQLFSELKTSHLAIHSDSESRKLWQGENRETGIESFYVEGELVISKVHPHSPASRAGLRFGDTIVTINKELANPEQAETESGDYVIYRSKKKFSVKIETAEIQRLEKVELWPLNSGTVVVKVPSFRAEFFEDAVWKENIQELLKYQHVILDLRGNLGGNFVASLRLLSPFLCKPTLVGTLTKPRSKLEKTGVLPNELEDEKQLAVVDENALVKLVTFEGYGCFKGSVQVLANSSTASAAEMAAQALKDFKGAKINGAPSAGQMLVGVWYMMPEVGPGVRLSIPEAIYKTQAGQLLEGPGVKLDRTLYYHFEDLERGEDSWIKAVSTRNVSE